MDLQTQMTTVEWERRDFLLWCEGSCDAVVPHGFCFETTNHLKEEVYVVYGCSKCKHKRHFGTEVKETNNAAN